MDYDVIRSGRKTIAIQIKNDGQIIVRCPARMPQKQIEAFVQGKMPWIEAHLPKNKPLPKFTAEEIRKMGVRALELLAERTEYFAKRIGVDYGSITIRNQRSRWGSCSANGNLNFNCLLVLTPPEVLDYVVVHELCHRKEMNHSDKFWSEVEKILPDYKKQRTWLKENGGTLIGRL